MTSAIESLIIVAISYSLSYSVIDFKAIFLKYWIFCIRLVYGTGKNSG